MADSRIEAILENILGADNPLPDPVSPNETLLKEISEQLETVPNETVTTADIEEIIGGIS